MFCCILFCKSYHFLIYCTSFFQNIIHCSILYFIAIIIVCYGGGGGGGADL